MITIESRLAVLTDTTMRYTEWKELVKQALTEGWDLNDEDPESYHLGLEKDDGQVIVIHYDLIDCNLHVSYL